MLAGSPSSQHRCASATTRRCYADRVSRRVSLPVNDPAKRPRSTIEAVRARLGGRARTDPQAGRVVCFLDTGATGVVLFGHGDEVHVFSNAGWVRRTTSDALTQVD